MELDFSAPVGNGLENRPEDIIGVSKLLGRMGLLKFDKTKEPSSTISTRLVESLKDLQRQNGLTPTGEFKPGDKTDAILKAQAEKLLGKKPARGRFDLDAVSTSANRREDEISARRLEENARDPRRRSGRLLDTLEDARDAARRRNDAGDLKNPNRDIFDENDTVNLRETQSRAVQMAKALDLDPDPDLSERSIRSKSLRNLADRIAASFEPVDDRPLRTLKGTTFFAGAGFEGACIQDFPKALAEIGVTNARAADAKRWSNGSPIDQIATPFSRFRDKKPSDLSGFGTAGKQLNLIGYSYGGLQASQAALDMADRGGKVDHLVLLASPISGPFLEKLKRHANIKEAIVIDLTDRGDRLHAGMSLGEFVASLPNLGTDKKATKDGIYQGHFFYSGPGKVGNMRRRELAKELFDRGLR